MFLFSFNVPLKADFHSVESSEWTGNLLFTRETVALNLNKMSHVADLLLCLFPSAKKILLSGNQPSLRADFTLHCEGEPRSVESEN